MENLISDAYLGSVERFKNVDRKEKKRTTLFLLCGTMMLRVLFLCLVVGSCMGQDPYFGLQSLYGTTNGTYWTDNTNWVCFLSFSVLFFVLFVVSSKSYSFSSLMIFLGVLGMEFLAVVNKLQTDFLWFVFFPRGLCFVFILA